MSDLATLMQRSEEFAAEGERQAEARVAAIKARHEARRAAIYREAAAHLEARAAGEDALGEYDTARSLRVGRDALTVRAAEIEKGLTT